MAKKSFFARFTQVTLVVTFFVTFAQGQREVESRDFSRDVTEGDLPSTSTPEPKYPDGVNTIPGDAEVNYPVYGKIFKTSFSCSGRLAGFYADIDARCQIWHICDVDGRMQSFLCTNGTIFSQETRVCEWWYNTNCDANYVRRNYEHNKELYKTLKKSDEDTQSSSGNEPRSGGAQVLTKAPPKPKPTAQVTSVINFPKKVTESQSTTATTVATRITDATKHRPNLDSTRGQPLSSQLSREELEQRRQAARAEFYSIPAKIEQDKRIHQQRLQDQHRVNQHQLSAPFGFTTFAPLPAQARKSTESQVPVSPTMAEVPQQKFRHSTPRQHNVSFRPTSRAIEIDDERQVPAETKQKAFPPFYAARDFLKRSDEIENVPGTIADRTAYDRMNSYLPTSNEPPHVRHTIPEVQTLPEIQVFTTSAPAPKLRKRKRRPRPVKGEKLEIFKSETTIPPPILSYRPPPLDPPLPPVKVPSVKSLSRAKPARIVVKRKFRKNDKELENGTKFPENPHLEKTVENEFNKIHATQKRCAVVGTGSVFRVLC